MKTYKINGYEINPDGTRKLVFRREERSYAPAMVRASNDVNNGNCDIAEVWHNNRLIYTARNPA